MEEGLVLTPFVSLEEEEEGKDVPLDFGEERVEIVTHLAESTTTKPKELTEEELQSAYGDLPKEHWAERAAVEQHFLAANPNQKHYDNFSGALPDSERAIVWGTNGEFSFAVQCLTREDSSLSLKKQELKRKEEKGKEKVEEKKSSREKALSESKSLAERNPAFGYKFATSLLECSAFVQTERHAIAQSRDPMHKMSEYKAIGKVDKTLLSGISELGPVLSQRLREDANQKPKNKNYRAQPRPGNAVSQVEYSSIELQEETEEFETRKSVVNFRLMICKTPRAAPSDDKRRAQWKDVNIVFACAPGTVPCGAFNQKNLAVLYQPHFGKKGLLHLEFIELRGNGKLIRTLKRRFYFPDGFATGGMLCTALNEENVFAVSLGQNVLILKDETHLLTLTSRRITSLEFSSKELLLLGSDAGECYTVHWSTGEVRGDVECTPAVEPVFSCASKNGNTYLHSVMGLSVMRPNPEPPVFLELDRPLAFDVCGTLIFVMTKYGGLKIFKRDVRRVMYQCEPRPQKHRVNGIQHAYRGIKAYEEHVVCVYPDGVVRRFSLVRK